MLCVLCLTEEQNVIEIFEEEGQSLCIDEIVIKHFWLQPNKSNPNERVICLSCWKALSSFHEFYVQIEETHRIHSKAVEKDGDLKLESAESAVAINKVAKITSDYLDSDIKLEVREDVEIAQDVENIQGNRKSSIDLESPPANSTRSRRCADIRKLDSQDDGDSVKSEDENPFDADQEWQNEEDGYSDSTGEDSDYVAQLTTDKVKQPTKSPPANKTKRGRKRKAQSKSSESKKYRSSGVQHLNATRMREFDEIIAKHMKLSCAICQDILYPDFGALHRHFRSEHNECGYVVCCTKKFRKRGLLVDHIWTHQNPEYFKCERCSKVLVNRKGLESHMLTHDTEKQRIFQCDQCPFSSFTRPILTRHMQTHISERNIKCPQCDKFFSTQDILRTHINNVHNASYTRICDQCGKTFRRPDAFKRHQLEHDGITQPLIPCEECNVKLTSKYGLKRHMESMHPKEDMKHICSECGKVAPSAAALQRHISYMHKMERKHECPMCGKAFKKRSTLKEHMTTHTGEVLYTCPHCPKTFNSNANMHSHRKKMHRKEWEENRRHPHLGTSANAKANADAMAAAAAAAAAAEESQQQ